MVLLLGKSSRNFGCTPSAVLVAAPASSYDYEYGVGTAPGGPGLFSTTIVRDTGHKPLLAHPLRGCLAPFVLGVQANKSVQQPSERSLQKLQETDASDLTCIAGARARPTE